MTLDTRTLTGSIPAPVSTPNARPVATRTLRGPVPITDAGRWGRQHDLIQAGSAIVAEAARHEPAHFTPTHPEAGDYDPSWNQLLQTSRALDLLLGIGTARLAG